MGRRDVVLRGVVVIFGWGEVFMGEAEGGVCRAEGC